ncbi:uncharacterized protein LOC132790723 [Drosophila nasuta]|uniref:uncharacterized protein LOC132790723 n=1 Tax=Drosophila nasuta TaxID=42062 RepID=UPI00295F1180|nr:uncharacterized protein LOC132790723 [Drosophila nasuta]XP_060655362.1 uncharacterized protein LOC132790723 [Drosophila nasuta]
MNNTKMEVSNEEAMEVPNEQVMAVSSEQVNKDSNEQSKEVFNEEPMQVSNEQPIKLTFDQPMNLTHDQPMKQHMGACIEKSMKVSREQPVKMPKLLPMKVTNEQPLDLSNKLILGVTNEQLFKMPYEQLLKVPNDHRMEVSNITPNEEVKAQTNKAAAESMIKQNDEAMGQSNKNPNEKLEQKAVEDFVEQRNEVSLKAYEDSQKSLRFTYRTASSLIGLANEEIRQNIKIGHKAADEVSQQLDRKLLVNSSRLALRNASVQNERKADGEIIQKFVQVSTEKTAEPVKEQPKEKPKELPKELPKDHPKELPNVEAKQATDDVPQVFHQLPNNAGELVYEVPMRHYAGKRLLITELIVPENREERRPSYFDRKGIEQMLLKYSAMENVLRQGPFNEELVDGILSAVETYAKYMVKSVIELCEHRTGYWLYNDPRCVMQHDMRSTMMFLNDREAADFGGADDETPGHRSRWMKMKRKLPGSSSLEHEMRLESTNTTALLALGGRKPTAASTLRLSSGVATALPPRAPPLRAKRVVVKDIVQFMENNKRYARSQLLYEAYLTYNL